MERWTRRIIRYRWAVLGAWIVLLAGGIYGAIHLGDLLSNRFSVPGSDAERGLDVLKNRFDERGDGAFTLVFKTQKPVTGTAAFKREAFATTQTASLAVSGAKPGPVQIASPTVAYAQINTPLENADASNKTDAIRASVPQNAGVKTYLSGFPAINHDTQEIYNKDLQKGETIAGIVALIVLAFMFGTALGILIPFAFAAVTIPCTLGAIYIAAHYTDMAIYVTNIATLIGLAIAIDYSMLVVFRFREELERHDSVEEALVTTMRTAGRATLFSGGVVAIGLSLLIFMPLPFMRSMGIGAALVPLFSIAASATFLPVLLFFIGRRINRFRVVPRRILAARAEGRSGFWTKLARSIMKRPVVYLVCAGGFMLALALPALQLHVTAGDNRGQPGGTEATEGLFLLEHTIGPGALAPNQIVIDTGRAGGALDPETIAAEKRLVASLRSDPEVKAQTIQAPVLFPPGPRGLALAKRANLIDSDAEVIQIRAAGHQDSGTNAAIDLVHRIRDDYIPAANFDGSTVLVTGAPAFGVDFIHRAYSAFPWLVLAVLLLSYLLLLRAFRSVFLPVKAVLLNVLSVTATYGVLVMVFQHNIHSAVGLDGSPQIEGWIPIFLFAMLFGLSMDYEVFLLSRMREEWDKTHDNETAVARGLEYTGRIVTAAAIIMIAAFAGFTAGSFVGLQEFGVGLSAAILFDATVVRALLVPAVMKLMGEWNWYLPDRVRRVLRLHPPSPASEPVTQTGK